MNGYNDYDYCCRCCCSCHYEEEDDDYDDDTIWGKRLFTYWYLRLRSIMKCCLINF